ncbi:MAG: preprotein translocase subunit YajC [Candidatus Omnitrophica bacterium CG11_big_fil_rev_8_21_14_0_20_45_26]|uniref:Sec translocon accessory complex subunit YajC n=1 Tax=Candidatus Abzuiibacterium crystallinum TaxID=1974748 RepID=A0A2H0LUH2_9BACT|nr:MAG: preprotein translocase subunit YajC [Candidatus Omnitrophica bacterium CG11_big_fil_rev_8_21_14_0_20_45_26]PIW64767.1 MAG: preprotein translocase subunit YajC [Candidatus Omnitrophica bacterium CG12_big_fil_rev_8_21_14_0_65_45_16]
MGPVEGNPIAAFLPLVLMFVIFYFLLIRPQQKKQKEHEKMVKALKKGDRVITAGGILGTIHTLQDNYVVIKTGDGDTKLEVLRTQISEIRK